MSRSTAGILYLLVVSAMLVVAGAAISLFTADKARATPDKYKDTIRCTHYEANKVFVGLVDYRGSVFRVEHKDGSKVYVTGSCVVTHGY